MITRGIPLWVTIVLGLIVLLSVVAGGLALLGNGMEDFMGPSWGGRNLGLGLAALAAILFKSLHAYLAVFFASIGREVGDIIQLSQGAHPDWPVVIFAVALLGVWIFGIIKAAQTLRQNN